MANRLLRDLESNHWEPSDFPTSVCESCVGDNPYLRMTLAEHAKECKICARPFKVAKWRPWRDSRYRKTEICQTCSHLKNMCQVCLLDLEHGLSVQISQVPVVGRGPNHEPDPENSPVVPEPNPDSPS